jgi:O-antigen ligase/polysaccharide polymerase Wzy-like membrane protein
VGMIGNPNAQGYVLALSFLALIYKELINHSKMNVIKGFIIFVALLMTLSRTSLVITLVGSLILILLYTKNKNFVYIKLSILSLLSFALFSLFIFIQQNEVLYNLILWRFESLANIMEDKSFITRFHGWVINIKFFLDNPILGVGPIPRGTELFGTADNEWLYFARSYGALGLIWLLLFFFGPFLVLRPKSKDEKNVRFFVFTALLMTMIYMIPAGVFTSSSLNGLLIVILAFYDKNHCYITNNNPEYN